MEKFIPEILRGNLSPVHCPLCRAGFNIKLSNSITCLNGHQYDIGPSGYIHLHTEPAATGKLVVLNRACSGMLERELLYLLYAEYAMTDSLTLLDAGSNDPGLFSNILLCMRWDQYKHQAIGIYEAAVSRQKPAGQPQQALWLVADMEQLPLQSNSVDVILNTLSNGSYQEFHRVLKPGGLLLMTVLLREYDVVRQESVSNCGFSKAGSMEISGIYTILCYRKGWY